MDRGIFVKTLPAVTLLASTTFSIAQEASRSTPSLQPISLPKPQAEGGKSVLAALWERKTNRNISGEKLAPQMLSNVLWAAFGVNREQGPFDQPGRAAASASNSQEIDLYVALPEGIYLYEAAPHRLVPVAAGGAPVNLIFVADRAKYSKAPIQEPKLKDPEFQKLYYGVATGLIAGNVYLFAASQGLAAWFHNCNREALAAELELRPEPRVLFAQTVGYPGKS